MDIFRQLGELFLAAVPTVIFVFLFYFFLRWSFFLPIERVIHERKSRIAGARQYAESVRATAQEKTRSYQEALRKARMEIFAEQEAARRAALDERNAAIQQARGRANDEMQVAKKHIAEEIEEARGELETSGTQLAEEIVHAILGRQPSSNVQRARERQ